MSDALSPSYSNISYWLLAIGLIMLLGTLLYPFGYDQAAFAVAGEMVRKAGAVPYRDFLDTKPPLIFYIYALSSTFFGHHMWSIRVLDLVFQLISAAYLYRIVGRYSAHSVARASAGLYLILYAGTGYWMTAQAEGFSTFFSLVIVDQTLRVLGGRGSALRAGVLAGCALLMLFLLKFTLIIGVAAVAFILLIRRPRRAAVYLSTTLVVLFAGVGLYLVALRGSNSLEQFWQSIEWVSRYSAIMPFFSGVTIAHQFNEAFILRLTTVCSAVALGLVVATVLRLLRHSEEETSRDLLSLLALTLAAHLIGILIERKLFNYHFDRILFAVAPLAAARLPNLLSLIGSVWKRAGHNYIPRLTERGAVVLGCCALAFYSPLFKFASQTVQWTSVYLSGKDVQEDLQVRTGEYFAADQEHVAHYATARGARTIFVWGNDVGIYYFANTLPTTLCLTATPFRTAWTPPAWRDSLLAQLQRTPTDLFIVEYGDAKDFITGSPDDSYQALRTWPELWSFVGASYAPDTTIGHFYVYRRR